LSSVIVIPGFSNLRPPERRPADRDWLVLELNLTYLRGSLLPELVNRYLGAGGKLDYVAEVVDADDPSQIIFQSGPGVDRLIHESADASVLLLNVPEIHGPPGGPPGRMYRMRFRGGRGPGYPHPPAFEPGAPPMPPPAVMGQGRWRLIVRHQAGSLESVVSRARWQNLATSLGILTLILITVATLVRLSRRAQRLAELQMNFVAGISHELRTPLAVIRTAAFNLRGKIAVAPEQVERYGALIQTESEKLGALVEQVLRFARARAGHPIGAREPVEIERVIDEGLQSIAASIPVSNVTVEKKIERDLPLVLADPVALKQAVQNLVENAMKYGLNGSNWIGISATRIAGANGASVEVRVADRGPGIPPDEQEHIFEPFFRGRRAVRDQIHGTGLGLNLAKNIVEAHGGALRVESDANKGAEFVLRIPAAPEEVQNEFAHTAG
jgi:signal transduction histidine kinase